MPQVLAGKAATANAVDGQPYERAALMLSVNEKRSCSGGAESSEILNHVMVTLHYCNSRETASEFMDEANLRFTQF